MEPEERKEIQKKALLACFLPAFCLMMWAFYVPFEWYAPIFSFMRHVVVIASIGFCMYAERESIKEWTGNRRSSISNRIRKWQEQRRKDNEEYEKQERLKQEELKKGFANVVGNYPDLDNRCPRVWGGNDNDRDRARMNWDQFNMFSLDDLKSDPKRYRVNWLQVARCFYVGGKIKGFLAEQMEKEYPELKKLRDNNDN